MENENMSQPANVTELYNSKEWQRKIRSAISKFKVRDGVDDMVSEIFLLMLQREDPEGLGRDYVQRWSPTGGGSFSNWIYTFVRNYCIKKYTRSRSAGGRLIEGALILAERAQGQEFPERGTVFADIVDSGDQHISQTETSEACAKIAHELGIEFPTHSWVEYIEGGYRVCDVQGKRQFFRDDSTNHLAGGTYARDMATVLKLLCDGQEAAEIAQLLKTSRQFVYSICEKLRTHEELVELREAMI